MWFDAWPNTKWTSVSIRWCGRCCSSQSSCRWQAAGQKVSQESGDLQAHLKAPNVKAQVQRVDDHGCSLTQGVIAARANSPATHQPTGHGNGRVRLYKVRCLVWQHGTRGMNEGAKLPHRRFGFKAVILLNLCGVLWIYSAHFSVFPVLTNINSGTGY